MSPLEQHEQIFEEGGRGPGPCVAYIYVFKGFSLLNVEIGYTFFWGGGQEQ